jgi:hypothetical protein
VQFGAEVTQTQGGIPVAIARVAEHLRDRVTRKMVRGDIPLRTSATQHEKPFAAGYQKGQEGLHRILLD